MAEAQLPTEQLKIVSVNLTMNNNIVQEMPLGQLLEHPENSNFMSDSLTRKLRRHIERTGRYEPLVVRPYPGADGKFQVINGHNRLRVLRALKYRTAWCVLWDIDDKQARLYLATLNRLSGKDIPERRASLLGNLLHSFDVEELTALLPDDQKQIRQLEQLAHIDIGEPAEQTHVKDEFKVPVILNFVLDELEAKELFLALDLILHIEKGNLSRSQALVCLARFYLKHQSISNEVHDE